MVGIFTPQELAITMNLVSFLLKIQLVNIYQHIRCVASWLGGRKKKKKKEEERRKNFCFSWLNSTGPLNRERILEYRQLRKLKKEVASLSKFHPF